MGEPEKRPSVFVDDDLLSRQIYSMLKAADIHVDLKVIRLIMQYQTNNYENLGIIRIEYRKR